MDGFQMIDEEFSFSTSAVEALRRDGYFIPPTQLLNDAGLGFCQRGAAQILEQLQSGRNPSAIFNAHQRPGGNSHGR
jgi:hypothetical protein